MFIESIRVTKDGVFFLFRDYPNMWFKLSDLKYLIEEDFLDLKEIVSRIDNFNSEDQ